MLQCAVCGSPDVTVRCNTCESSFCKRCTDFYAGICFCGGNIGDERYYVVTGIECTEQRQETQE